MDKLTIEEKAKRYDELSKEVKDFFDGKQKMYSDVGQTLSYLFPEFRDSEDERIRKSIISGMKALQKKGKYTRFANIPVNNVIAWLEKQGEQRSITIDADKMASKYSHTKDGDFGLPVNCQIRAYRQGVNDVLNLLLGIEKQGEQEEPQVYETENGEIITYSETDGYKVVEPKFKIGDWIIYKDNVWKICNISLKTYYELLNINNEVSTRHIEDVDKDYHLWTIQDAKDGDVLTNDFNEIFIFKNINKDIVISHCSIIDRTSDAIVNSFDEIEVGSLSMVNFYPATKEQRDTLMKAMADAGYTFDFEKKEVRKIKQKPAEWSKEDELHIRELESLVKQAWVTADRENDKETIHKMSDLAFFLKTLKPQLKREWSKEDEEMIEGLNNCLDELEVDNGWYYVYVNNKNIKLSKVRNWLKSLRPHINVTDKELGQAKKDAYNDALDKIEYHSGEPTFDDGWSAAIDYIRKKSLRP